MFNARPAPKRVRDPLAGVRRAMHCDAMRRQREGMTAAEVEAAARKLIRDRFDRDGQEAEITMAIFRSANLPMDKVSEPLVRSLIRFVLADMAGERP